MTMLKLISAQDHQPPAEGDTRTVALPNDADAMALPLGGVERVDLHFPNFTDGRAFSQAFLLRRRRGYQGDIRATGDVLVDQLQQMARTGFTEAVLRADQNLAHGEKLLGHYAGFYQGDAVHTQPHFTDSARTEGGIA